MFEFVYEWNSEFSKTFKYNVGADLKFLLSHQSFNFGVRNLDPITYFLLKFDWFLV